MLYHLHSTGDLIGHGPAGTRRVLLPAVAKQNGGRGAAYAIANEFICGELARFHRLPAPPIALASLPDGTPCVASLDFNPACHPCPPVDVGACLHRLPVLSAGLLLFDIWIANPDRHNGNFHVNWNADPPAMYIYDHCQALCGHIPGEAVARMERLRDQLATGSCFVALIKEDTRFPLWLGRIRATPDFFIEELCAEARPFGLTEEECAATVAFLKHRRDTLPAIILSHRSAFKGISGWSLASTSD